MERAFYCPRCKIALGKKEDKYICSSCDQSYPLIDGIISLISKGIIKDADVFDAAVFERIFGIEQKHFWHNGRKEIILAILKRHIPNLAECRMLEIGCGTGYVLSYLRQNGIDIEGADISIDGMKYCQKRLGQIGLYQVDILALPFLCDFDIIGIFDVLEHIEEDEYALENISQALKPGGKLLITVPAHKFLWSYADEFAHHKRRYSKKELVDKLERNGFIVKKASFYMFFLLPLVLSMRLINSIIRGESARRYGKSDTEHKIIPFVNGAFLRLLRLEECLIRYINFPFGACLVVLAEKK